MAQGSAKFREKLPSVQKFKMSTHRQRAWSSPKSSSYLTWTEIRLQTNVNASLRISILPISSAPITVILLPQN